MGISFRVTIDGNRLIYNNNNKGRFVTKSDEFDDAENHLIDLVVYSNSKKEDDTTNCILSTLKALQKEEYFQNCIDYALIFAVRNLNLELVRVLVDMGAKPVCTMLIYGISDFVNGERIDEIKERINEVLICTDFLASFKLLNGIEIVDGTKNKHVLFDIFEWGRYELEPNEIETIYGIIKVFIDKFDFKISTTVTQDYDYFSGSYCSTYCDMNLYQIALRKELFGLAEKFLVHEPTLVQDIEYTFKLLENLGEESHEKIFTFQINHGFDINSIYNGHNLLIYLAKMQVIDWRYSFTQVVTYDYDTEEMLINLTKLLIEKGINLKYKTPYGLNAFQVASVLETGVFLHLKTLDPKVFE